MGVHVGKSCSIAPCNDEGPIYDALSNQANVPLLSTQTTLWCSRLVLLCEVGDTTCSSRIWLSPFRLTGDAPIDQHLRAPTLAQPGSNRGAVDLTPIAISPSRSQGMAKENPRSTHRQRHLAGRLPRWTTNRDVLITGKEAGWTSFAVGCLPLAQKGTPAKWNSIVRFSGCSEEISWLSLIHI